MDKIATLNSERASRYMTALCHHFGRKVETGCENDNGWVQFPFGRCEMSVENNELTFRAHAEDPRQLEQVIQVMSNHLDRFAFRENPELNWQPAGL